MAQLEMLAAHRGSRAVRERATLQATRYRRFVGDLEGCSTNVVSGLARGFEQGSLRHRRLKWAKGDGALNVRPLLALTCCQAPTKIRHSQVVRRSLRTQALEPADNDTRPISHRPAASISARRLI